MVKETEKDGCGAVYLSTCAKQLAGVVRAIFPVGYGLYAV